MTDSQEKPDILIISGLSGSGKSVASKALEDIGYFCIDNLPLGLLEKLLSLVKKGQSDITRLALVMDSRDSSMVNEGQELIAKLRKKKYPLTILFLECNDDILMRRFKETRRTHHLDKDQSITTAISSERKMLSWLKLTADVTIDTSNKNVHQLRQVIQDRFSDPELQKQFNISFISFGFRYGLPLDADLVMDVRFLPNPYWVQALKDRSGLEKDVAQYVLQADESDQFLKRFSELLDFMLPFYPKKGKHYLTVGIGCTGGKHRSVSIVEELSRRFGEKNIKISVFHRDIEKSN